MKEWQKLKVTLLFVLDKKLNNIADDMRFLVVSCFQEDKREKKKEPGKKESKWIYIFLFETIKM